MKGLFLQKIKANLSIIRNWGKIKQKYNQIQQQKKFQDHEIIKYFDDEIIIPSELSRTAKNSIFLNLIKKISNRARKKIISRNL